MSPESPERAARKNIDGLLTAAGWTVQDFRDRNLFAGRGRGRKPAAQASLTGLRED